MLTMLRITEVLRRVPLTHESAPSFTKARRLTKASVLPIRLALCHRSASRPISRRQPSLRHPSAWSRYCLSPRLPHPPLVPIRQRKEPTEGSFLEAEFP